MRRVFFLIFVGLVTLFIVLLAKRPDILEEFKLWMLGLVAPTIGLIQYLWKEGKTILSQWEEKLFPAKKN